MMTIVGERMVLYQFPEAVCRRLLARRIANRSHRTRIRANGNIGTSANRARRFRTRMTDSAILGTGDDLDRCYRSINIWLT